MASLLIAGQAAARQGQGVETVAHAIGGDAASAVDSEGGPSPSGSRVQSFESKKDSLKL